MTQTKSKEKLAKIKVLNGCKTILVDEFDTTFYTVSRALNGEIDTELSVKIREAAFKIGGEVVDEELEKSTNPIKVYGGDRAFLVEKFNTSFFIVSKALSGKTRTLLSYQIRAEALKRGGKEELPEEEKNKNTTEKSATKH